MREPMRLRDLLEGAGRDFGLGPEAMSASKIWALWLEIVGPAMATHSRPTSLREGTLRIITDSPAWANEVSYLADEIKRRANQALGADAVASVRAGVSKGRFETLKTDANSAHNAPSEDRPEGESRAVEDPTEALSRAAEHGLGDASESLIDHLANPANALVAGMILAMERTLRAPSTIGCGDTFRGLRSRRSNPIRGEGEDLG